MTYDALWTALHDAGITVHSVANNLRVTHASALTPDLRDALRRHKEAILAELSLPLVEHALLVFGGFELNEGGRPLRRQPLLIQSLEL